MRDKERARAAVAAAVKRGDRRPLSEAKCLDCGAPAEHYHHYRGYERKFWLCVLPVCRKCHGIRHRKERAVEPTWQDAWRALRNKVARLTPRELREIAIRSELYCLSPATERRILRLRSQRLSYRKVAADVGLHFQTVYRVVQRLPVLPG